MSEVVTEWKPEFAHTPFFLYLTPFIIVAFLAIGVYIKRKELKVIQLRLKFRGDERYVIHNLLLNSLKCSKKDPNKILNNLLNGITYKIDNIDYNNDQGIIFWKTILNSHKTNLIYCLQREHPDDDVLYFKKLLETFKEEKLDLNPKKYKIFSEIIGQAKVWSNPKHKNKQNAARLGAISIFLKLTFSLNYTEEEKMKHWNMLLGLIDKEIINVNEIFCGPFHTDKSDNFKPKCVYNNGIKIFEFFKKIDFVEGMKYVKKALSETIFESYFDETHFLQEIIILQN